MTPKSQRTPAYRVFRGLLRCYPARLRDRRGAEMWAVFCGHLDDARARRQWLVVAWLWGQEIAAALLALATPRHEGLPRSSRTPLSLEDWMHNWLLDVRHAFRLLRTARGFALTVIATLGIGIGASTAMFTVVRGVLLRPLDFERPEELVSVWARDVNLPQSPFTPGDFLDLQRQSRTLAEVTGRWSGTTSLLGDGEPEQVSVAWVSDNYFPTLGLEPALGRWFGPMEFDAVMISDPLWRRRFGADSSIVGRSVRLGNSTMQIVGVLPAETNPNVATVGGRREQNDVFRLWPADEWLSDDRTTAWIRVIARVVPNANAAEVETDLAAVTGALVAAVPERAQTRFELYTVGLHDEMVQAARPYLLTLSGGVLFVFLIACFNVTNLTLVRSHHRRRELAVRTAIGAGRRALVRQLFVESGTLAVLGGVSGIVLAYLATDALLALQPGNVPRLETVGVDGGVLLFAVVVSCVAAVIVGVGPAWRGTKIDPATMLHERAGTATRKQHRFARTLIAAEVALSLVLLTGSGLLLRTFMELSAVDPGYEAENLFTVSISNSSLAGEDRGEAFLREVLRRTRAVPGVTAAGFSNRFPFAGGIFGGAYATEAQFASGNPKPEAAFRWITPGFLEAMGARLLAGRTITDTDAADVAVIDDVMARTAWPGEDPLGKRVWTGSLGRDGEWAIVVGVVQQMRHNDLRAAGQETIFFPGGYQLRNSNRLAIRTSGPPDAIMPQVRDMVRTIDAEATVSRAQTANELLADAIAPTRFAMLLVTVFATIAVLLAAVGVFGVVSFAVRQRTREFGLRLALGETPPRVFRSVVRQGLAVSAVGIAVGLLGTAVLTRFLRSLLFEVDPLDPVTLFAGAAVMGAVGVLGGVFPARRAAAVDPAATLKAEG